MSFNAFIESASLGVISHLHLVGVLFVLLTVYTFIGIIYRLYYSPVAAIPGPRLAALTFGPIVRINLYEIHIDDPAFYDEIYVGATRGPTNKWEWSAKQFENSSTMVGAVDHDVHRKRRALLNPYFSKLSVRRLEPVIQQTAAKLYARLEGNRAKDEPVNIMSAYCALTADLISEYCFGHSYGLLAQHEYGAELYAAIVGHSEKMHITKQFDWFIPLLQKLPAWVRQRVFPSIHVLLAFRRRLEQQVVEMKAEWEEQLQGKDEGKESVRRVDDSNPNIFSSLLDPNLPPSELSTHRLVGEAQVLIFAGTVTLAHTMTVATYHVLTNAPVLSSFVAELTAAIPDPASPASFATLESLPHLNAVILESLRIGYGVPHRLQRIAPSRSVQYEEYTVPPGVPVSMDSVHMHTNATIFPDPHRFDPERWLPLETEGQRLQKYLVAMSRGSRMCIGVNLAFAELLIGLGRGFRGLGSEMEGFGTERARDVDVTHDLFNPMPEKRSRGVWGRFRGEKG